MKILHVLHGWFPRHGGGTERYVAALARRQAQLGHRVAILAGSERARERAAIERERWENLPLFRLHRTGLYLDSWYHSYSPEAEELFRKLLDRLRPDVVHVHHWQRLSRGIVALATRCGIPVVCTLHDTGASCPRVLRIRDDSFCRRFVSAESCGECVDRLPFQDDQEIALRIEAWKQDFARELASAAAVIAPSPALAAVVSAQHPQIEDRLEILPHGFPTQRSPEAGRRRRGDELRLVTWGDVSRMKGSALLVEAVGKMKRRAAVTLDVWGSFAADDPTFEAELRERADGLPIVFRGPFRVEELRTDDYDVAVFPSIACESHSFTVDEAFDRELPAIVPSRGGPADRLGGAGATFSPERASDLARLLDSAAEDRSLVAGWREAVRPPKRMDVHVEEIQAIYDRVVSEGVAAERLRAAQGGSSSELELSFSLGRRDRELFGSRGELASARESERDLRAQIARKEEVLDGFQRQLERLSALIAEKDRELAEAGERQRAREAELEARLLERDATIRSRDAALETMATSARELRAALDEARRDGAAAGGEAQRAAGEAQRAADEAQRATDEAQRATEEAHRIAGERDRLAVELAETTERVHELTAGVALREETIAELAAASARLREERAALSRQLEHDRLALAASERRRAEIQARAERHEAAHENLVRLREEDLRALSHAAERLEHQGDELERLREHAAELVPIAAELRGPSVSELGIEAWIDGAIGNHDRLHRIIQERDALIEALVEQVEEQAKTAGLDESGTGARVGLRAQLGGRLASWRRRFGRKREGDRMRILIVVHDFLPRHAAGTEIYTYKLAKQLQQRHDVHLLFCEARHEQERYRVSKGEYDGLPYTEVVHNYRWESFEETYRDPRMEEIFTRVLDEVDPDLVHVQHLHYFSFGFISIAKERGLPVVYTLHEYMILCARGGQLLREDFEICEQPVPSRCADCIRHERLAGSYGRPSRRRRLELASSLLPEGLKSAFERYTGPLAAAELDEESRAVYAAAIEERLRYIGERLALVDLFISPSAFLRQKMIDSGMVRPQQIVHSDNGFDLSLFADVPRTESDVVRFGFVGTIAEYKGVHLLIEAFAGLEDEPATLTIWGDVDTFEDYKRRLLALPRGENVRLAGRFDNDRIAEILAQIDVLIVPSLWFENSPLTIHEAWMAGVPVIASDRGGMAELVRDGIDGLHFRLGDADDLRAKILRVLREPELIARWRENLGEVKAIEDNALEIEGYYRALLAGSRVGER